jgi:rubredoxin
MKFIINVFAKQKGKSLEDKPFEMYRECPECGFLIIGKTYQEFIRAGGGVIPRNCYGWDSLTVCPKCGHPAKDFKQVGIAIINGEEKRRYYE